MVSIENLSFAYKKNIVLDNVSFEMKSGIYGLLGKNGVGKTTLLHIISGLRFPIKGSCRVNGYDSYKRNPFMLEELFFLPEEYNVPELSPTKFAKINAPLYPKFSNEQFQYYLKEFDLKDTDIMSGMSMGEQKKAMIAYALSLNTQHLLLDEPTNGLDIPSKAIFRRLLSSIADEDKCIIISTHQVRDLENLIDPIIILDQKQVLLNNSIEEITSKLIFEQSPTLPDDTIYSESSMQGYLSVRPNTENAESVMSIEILFNAAIQNKELFKELFNLK